MLRISQPRIISSVRLVGKLRIFRPLLEYCALHWTDLPGGGGGDGSEGPNLTSEMLTKTRYKNWHRIPLRLEFLTLRESFNFPAKLYSGHFLRLW